MRERIRIGPHTLIHGDCLEELPRLAEGSVDAVVTDPPYSSGGAFRGDRTQSVITKYVQTTSVDTCKSDFSGDNRDQRSFLAWSTMWLNCCHYVAKPGAVIVCFTDWRQLPTFTDAIQAGGWVWRNIGTWWKPGCRMQKGRLSSSAEYVVYGSIGIPTEGEKSPQNVFAFAPVGGEDKVHVAEKPVEVLTWAIGLTKPAAVVADPFMGSGTTGVACVLTDRLFVGIEKDRRSFDVACERIQKAVDDRGQQRLFDFAPIVQGVELFGTDLPFREA
jgi:site-specific DNA-methyltransferase (adenine-specific)